MADISTDIALVIVLYNPNGEEKDNIRRVAGDFPGVIVDNSSVPTFSSDVVGKMSYVPLKYNAGIAKAQNEGIKILMGAGNVRYIVFFDQDSVIPESYPYKIVSEYKRINDLMGGRLSCLGPKVCDKNDGEEYHSVIHKESPIENGFQLKSEIISSGSCVSIEKFKEVGLLDEGLFIDFVDTEWCFRSCSKGFVCGITDRVELNHEVGKQKLHLGKHIIIISAPVRYFYQYRNFLLLATRGYVPWNFKFFKGSKFLIRWFYFPFINGGMKRWKYMNKGIISGVRAIIKKGR